MERESIGVRIDWKIGTKTNRQKGASVCGIGRQMRKPEVQKWPENGPLGDLLTRKKGTFRLPKSLIFNMVGRAGFEPA
jgi:hypothetical protein